MYVLMRTIKMFKNEKKDIFACTGLPKKNIKDRCAIQMCAALNGELSLTVRYARRLCI